jgi:hypothetical protein
VHLSYVHIQRSWAGEHGLAFSAVHNAQRPIQQFAASDRPPTHRTRDEWGTRNNPKTGNSNVKRGRKQSARPPFERLEGWGTLFVKSDAEIKSTQCEINGEHPAAQMANVAFRRKILVILFHAQCHHGVHSRGAARRKIAGEQGRQ